MRRSTPGPEIGHGRASHTQQDRPAPAARGLLIRLGALAALLLVALAAAVQGRPRFRPPSFLGGSLGNGGQATPDPSPAPSQAPTPPPVPVEPNPLVRQLLEYLGIALALVFALMVAYGLYRWVRGRWQDREFRRREGSTVTTPLAEVAPEEAVPDAATVQRGLASALDTIDQGAPSDAIIAAWLELEQTASVAGLQRSPTETAGEFAVRIVTRHDGVRLDAEHLLGLFEGVRFGGAHATEADRESAKAALRQIEQVWR